MFGGRTRHVGAAVLALVAAATTLIAQQASRADVTGTWALEVVTDAAGTTNPTVTLKQQGDKLTGHYSSTTLGEADVTGTVKDQNVTFSFSVSLQGMPIDVTYTATVDGKDSMKGKISLTGVGEGTFTGKRK